MSDSIDRAPVRPMATPMAFDHVHIAGVGDVGFRRLEAREGDWAGFLQQCGDWTSDNLWGAVADLHPGLTKPSAQGIEVIDGFVAWTRDERRGDAQRIVGLAFLTGFDKRRAERLLGFGSSEPLVPAELGLQKDRRSFRPEGGYPAAALVVDVDGAFRGLGIGTALLRLSVQSAIDHGCGLVEMSGSRLDRSLLALGQRLGFDLQTTEQGRMRLALNITRGSQTEMGDPDRDGKTSVL